MLWCCSLADCDKNNAIAVIGNLFRSKKTKNTNKLEERRRRSTRSFGQVNPCLEDVTSTEEDDTRFTHTDSTSTGNTPSPEYYQSELIIFDRQHIAANRHQVANSAPSADATTSSRLYPSIDSRQHRSNRSPPVFVSPAVQNIVTATDKRSWGNWWRSRASPIYETFCHPPESDLSQLAKENASKRNTKESSAR